MRFHIESIRVNQDGSIYSREDVTDKCIYETISIDEAVGDDYTVKYGDLRFKTREELPGAISVGQYRYVALFLNDILFNIYFQSPYDALDEKRGLYEYRLYSVTQFFIQNAQNKTMAYNTDPDDWNYDLATAWANGQITVTWDDSSTSVLSDRYVFLISEILDGLAGKKGTWFQIGTVSHTFPARGQDTAIWWRGTSESITLKTVEEGITKNFGNTWWDFLKTVLIAHDSFLVISPKIENIGGTEYIKLDLEFLNKTYNINKTPESIYLKELEHEYQGFGVDGVQISGNNFTFTISQKDMERTVETSDPDQPQSDLESKVYFCGAFYDSGGLNTWDYDSDQNYFSTAWCEPYYTNLVNKKKKYKGEALFDIAGGSGLIRAGDVISVNGVNIMVTRVTNTADGTAKFEGHEV